MTVVNLGQSNVPNFICNTIDIVNSMVSGASRIGGTVLDVQTGLWYVIQNDLTLTDYTLPVSFNGNIDIGAVDQGTGGSSAWKVDGSAVTQPVSLVSVPTHAVTEASLDASIVTQGTTAPTKVQILGGKTNDGTPQYREIPEGAGGRSVIVEGIAGGTPQPISGTVDTELPAASALNGTIVKSVSAPVVGAALLVSDNTNLIQPLGDAANGLDVDVTRLPALVAGTAVIGSTSGNTAQIDVVPTLTVHATYVSGDYVGTSATAMVFSGASRINNFTGTILSAVLMDGDLQSVACELWLFDTAITPPADSAAWTLSDADCARCIGIIPFSTYYASALNSISFAQGVGIGFKTLSASTSIYGCLVTRGAPTYNSGNLTVRLTILQD